MLKGEVIAGYYIVKDGTLNGMCSWTFATKEGKEYFIKEFLHPTYPTSDAPGSPKTKEKKRIDCDAFEKNQKEIINIVKSKCSIGGNLIFAIDFFRYNTKYYKVTEKVDIASIPLAEISTLDLKKQALIMTTVAFSLKILHDLEIVHGDLKPDNVLIKKVDSGLKDVEASYTTKLIDFDSSFFERNPPDIAEDMVGDIAYYSPELFRYIKKDEKTTKEQLTTKSDIFALGLIFCKYLTNTFPIFNKEKYKFISVAINNGESIEIAKDLCPLHLEEMINSMLLYNPDNRPDIKSVHQTLRTLLTLKDIIDWKKPAKETGMTEIKSKLRISMGVKKDIMDTSKIDEPTKSRVRFGKGFN